MTQIHKEILPGVFLRCIQTQKFKSAQCSVMFNTPLSQESAAPNALIPLVLYRGTMNHPTMEDLMGAFDELYGASVYPVVRKRGETQSVGFIASLLDDAYTFDHSQLVEPLTQLLGEILLSPLLEDGGFCKEYVEGERNQQTQRIRSQINNKQGYATNQLVKAMCREEAFGVERLGSEESVAAITPESLWKQYQALLTTAEITVYFCGTASPERVEAAVRAMFAGLPPRSQPVHSQCQVRQMVGETQMITESLDVTQGKLVMGFRTGGVTVWEADYPALALAVAIFGGTSMSKLFMNVREKLSLCYYASATLERYKGLVMVSSGIEFDKFDQAREEILLQLKAVQQGDITPEEMEGTRRIIVNSFISLGDEQSSLEEFWTGQSVAGVEYTPQDFIQKLEQVTLEQVATVAQKIQLDTVYFLKGLEE